MGESISTERVISENNGLEFLLKVVSTLERRYNAALGIHNQGQWYKQSDSYTAVYFAIFFCDSKTRYPTNRLKCHSVFLIGTGLDKQNF